MGGTEISVCRCSGDLVIALAPTCQVGQRDPAFRNPPICPFCPRLNYAMTLVHSHIFISPPCSAWERTLRRSASPEPAIARGRNTSGCEFRYGSVGTRRRFPGEFRSEIPTGAAVNFFGSTPALLAVLLLQRPDRARRSPRHLPRFA